MGGQPWCPNSPLTLVIGKTLTFLTFFPSEIFEKCEGTLNWMPRTLCLVPDRELPVRLLLPQVTTYEKFLHWLYLFPPPQYFLINHSLKPSIIVTNFSSFYKQLSDTRIGKQDMWDGSRMSMYLYHYKLIRPTIKIAFCPNSNNKSPRD